MKLADEENFELTDDQLEFLASGGCCATNMPVCENRKYKRPI